jgi:carbohydrate kinase (thermoresistant glucokinase family)
MSGPGHTPPVIVVMGVSGCGKSTVGRLLAERLGSVFQEGDDLHPAANVAKMRAGVPLTDEDRRPWLDRVAAWIDGRLAAGESGVVACSALKRTYREQLARPGGVVFVHLAVDRHTLEERLAERRGHFMPPALLASQLKTLEEPGTDAGVIRVDATKSAETAADSVLERLATLR